MNDMLNICECFKKVSERNPVGWFKPGMTE